MILKTIAVIVAFVVLKWLWVTISTMGHGTFEGEKTEILRRRNYLTINFWYHRKECSTKCQEVLALSFRVNGQCIPVPCYQQR